MFWILIIATLVLLIAPLRRLFFSRWFIILPAIGGLWFGLSYACNAVGQGAPGIIMLLAPAFAVAAFVGAFREAFGGKSGRRNDDEQ